MCRALSLLIVHVLDRRDLALAVAHQAGLGRPHDGGERLVHLAAELGDVALRQLRVVARDARRRDRRGDEGREARRGERRIPPRAARGREREPGAVVGDVVHRDVRGEREGGRVCRVELASRIDAREQRLERGGVRAVVERRVTSRRLIEVAGRAPLQDARERDLRERVRRGDRVPVNGTSRFAPPWMAWMKSLAFADQPLLVRFGVWQNAQVGASFRCPAWNVGIEPSWSWQALHFAFDTIVRRAVWFFAVFQTFGAATTRPPSFFWKTRGIGELQSTVTPPPMVGPHVTAAPVALYGYIGTFVCVSGCVDVSEYEYPTPPVRSRAEAGTLPFVIVAVYQPPVAGVVPDAAFVTGPVRVAFVPFHTFFRYALIVEFQSAGFSMPLWETANAK